ncbi:metallophosphoesterase [Puniceicoccaceae bacterium K14]|nr:metallophosphoesterase [Puniceicoccaceae bacterium K14]
MKRYKIVVVFLLGLVGCLPSNGDTKGESNSVRVAFLADVHLSDIYGELSDSDYRGVLNPGNGEYAFIRTMQSQLLSTRLFNENYFAFLAALEDVVDRGIRYVVLPGDFSDDGQPLNIRGLRRILEKYRDVHGVEFILSTGNHDPVLPFEVDSGKSDFLGEGGERQIIASRADLYQESDHVVVTADIRKSGYKEILTELGEFGFFPREENTYWETPFTDYGYENYNFSEAQIQSNLEKRTYDVSPGFEVPDVSYLLEPEEGVWFLAIDANVYVPKAGEGSDPNNPVSYGKSSVGYNNVLSYKAHLFDWVASVMERAKKLGKKVFVFSHYPMVDFNDGASKHIEKLMGEGKMQLHRVPHNLVAEKFFDAEVTVHFGGHMHINDTGTREFGEGLGFVNVQIPSLAAYIPAYKIATYSGCHMNIETIVVGDVPRFKELFPLYETEYEYLLKSHDEQIWNKEILQSSNYREFTQWHLKELVRLRILVKDWPDRLKDFLLKSSGYDLLKFAGSEAKYTNSESSFSWTGFDMIFDFYRLRSADKLAFSDITAKRIQEYEIVINDLLSVREGGQDEIQLLKKDLVEFAHIFQCFLNGAPADNFSIDVPRGLILE